MICDYGSCPRCDGSGAGPCHFSDETLDAYRAEAACESPARYLTRAQAAAELAGGTDAGS